MVSFPTKDAQEQRVKPLNAISISVVELGTEMVNRVIEMMIEIVIRCSTENTDDLTAGLPLSSEIYSQGFLLITNPGI